MHRGFRLSLGIFHRVEEAMLVPELVVGCDCAQQVSLDTEERASILLGPSAVASADYRIGDGDARRAVASNILV